jgi:2-desacetyl-2-hydroxyethyl bacteriochlorophyllide A dehydrogenase
MKKSIYSGNHRFAIEEAPAAKPAAGEVRISVAYCGVCGTDMHIFHGKMDARVKPPQTVGHEMSGIIEALGDGVTGWKVGDPVTVRPLLNCGECAACLAGFGHVCMKLVFVGIDSPGAFQQAWNVPARLLHRLPPGLPLDLAALIEPLAVACHDVRRARLVSGEKAVVLGAGPIGMFVALVARAHGAQVLMVELDESRRAFAASLGFQAIPADEGVKAKADAWTGGVGADAVFECTAAPACALLMTHLVRVRGRVVVVGIYSQPAPVDLKQLFWREVEIYGARVYEPQDFDEAIALAAGGGLPLEKMISARLPLSEIQSGFEKAGMGMKTLIQCSPTA